MSCTSCCGALCSFVRWLGEYFQSILLLILRVYWGAGLQATGLGKFYDHAHIAEYFSSLGIPFPELMVYVVATIEFIGGWCLILGLFSRIAAIPLIVTMIVALLTAHVPEVSMILHDQAKFVTQPPVTYLLVSLVVFAFGAGFFSIDAWIGSRCCKKES